MTANHTRRALQYALAYDTEKPGSAYDFGYAHASAELLRRTGHITQSDFDLLMNITFGQRMENIDTAECNASL